MSVTINVERVEDRGNKKTVEMSGSKPALMPDIVAKSRVRLKAIRVVGLEQFGRAAGEAISEGDFGRVTEIVDYVEGTTGDMVGSEFTAVVVVETGQ